MPATAERMTLVMSEFRSVVAGPDAAVIAKYGDAARDTGDDLVETFFRSTADAQIFANERLGLMSRDAVRLEMAVQGDQTGLDIALGSSVVTAHATDDERSLARNMIVTGARVNFAKTTSQLSVWG